MSSFPVMASSKVFGGAEECQSSESGWTMYIGSPIHSDDGGHSSEGDYDDTDDTDPNHVDDSDDSMASDASSGMAHFKHEEEDEDDGKCATGSYKKAKRQMGKQLQKDQTMVMKKKEEKEQKMMFSAKRGVSTTPARSDSKVRKNVCMGKRK